MTMLMRNLVPVALLFHVRDVQADTTSSSAALPPTPSAQIIAFECAGEISSCGTDSECTACLTALLSADIPDESTTSDTDCAYAFTEFCEFFESVGCNIENALVDDFAECVAGDTFEACEGFESCSVYLSATPTVPPTFSPIPTPQTQAPSGVSTLNPTASSSSSAHDETTAPTAASSSSPTPTALTWTPSAPSTVTSTASPSSMPTVMPSASPSGMLALTPTASPPSTHSDASGAPRRLQDLSSTTSFCFTLAYVLARAAHAA